jgi:hypothetical protein
MSDTEIDYDDPKFNQGVEHVVDLLAKTIGAHGWHHGDGSEDYDCDLAETLLNILAAKGLYDKDDAEFADARIARLRAIINTPETEDFMKGIPLEAAHQRERWGVAHDGGKGPLDWFWLIGYLAQKAATSAMAGDVHKAKHHTISTAAALANWHLRLSGGDDRMRPGIAPPEGQ